jgi:hypothetical protein
MVKQFVLATVAGVVVFSLLLSSLVLAQKQKANPSNRKVRTVIFAVLNGGTAIEPIGFLDKGKLSEAPVGVGVENNSAFVKDYYSSGVKYNLIFGGASSGSVSIKSSNIGKECGGSSANVGTTSGSAKLTDAVMALSTNAAPLTTNSTRRRPSVGERSEIESLVKAEFAKHKIIANPLRYQNLTAVDVDHNGIPEFVGSFWTAPKKDERAMLFVIAEKNSDGKYILTHSGFETFKPKDVMSGEMTDLDNGIYHSLLLDVFDVDGDGVAEIFTVAKAFEGNNYHVYQKSGGKWERIFETYSYRCGY